MLEEIQFRAQIVAHYDDMLIRLARRIDRLRAPLPGPLWRAAAQATVIRYEAEIKTTRAAMERLQEKNRGGQRLPA